MLDRTLCLKRRQAFLASMDNPKSPLVLADPAHLTWLSGFYVDPFSLGSGFGGILVINPDASCVIFYDTRLPDSVSLCVADDIVAVNWYDGITHPKTTRALSLLPEVEKRFPGAFIHDRIDTSQGVEIHKAISKLRRKKYPDEIALIKRSAQIAEKAHAWVLNNIAPGMTELDVYSDVQKICTAQGGQPLIVYGDFAVSPGPDRKGGPPTQLKLKESDMFILDFSVVLFGYRSDFTNTLVVGKKPSSSQQQLMDFAKLAMNAGENNLLEGVNACHVYQSVMDVFLKAGFGEHFPHHAGHGLGLSHPEAPFIVPGSDEILVAGDVITLEPGLYVPNVGGLRIERNYLITESGFKCLTHHDISLI